MGGVGNGGTVVASRGGDDAGSGDFAEEKIGERTPSFERAGVLELLEFQHQRKRSEAEIGACEFEDRRDADVRANGAVGGLDGLAGDDSDGRSPFVCDA